MSLSLVRRWFAGVVVLTLVLSAGSLAVAQSLPPNSHLPAAAEQYLALRFPGATAPGAYLLIDSGALRLARTAANTKEAPVLLCSRIDRLGSDDGREGNGYYWKDINLTSYMGGRGELQVMLQIREWFAPDAQQKNTPPVLDATFWGVLRARDRAGTPWTYRFILWSSEDLNSDPAAAPVARMPAPGPVKLVVDTRIEGHDVRIGPKLMLDGVRLNTLQKGWSSDPVTFDDYRGAGPYPTVRLEVRDAKGKLVHEQDGNMVTFSYTWGDIPTYLLGLDKDGAYTARMTLYYPDFKLTGQASFTIPGKEPAKTK